MMILKLNIENCVKILNDRLKGTAVSALMEKMEAIKPILENYVSDNDVIYQVFMEAFLKFARNRISLFGKGQLFNQEDIASDADKLRRVLNLLDSPDEIRKMLIANDSDEISISINDSDVSIITSRIKMPNQDDGTIALVGPKRMDYEKVVGALEYVAQELEKYFAKERKKNGRE